MPCSLWYSSALRSHQPRLARELSAAPAARRVASGSAWGPDALSGDTDSWMIGSLVVLFRHLNGTASPGGVTHEVFQGPPGLRGHDLCRVCGVPPRVCGFAH
ncbi:hypothetical protein SZN_05754 [Streptomyces zinciresistens K42]|uniref:Uncharacterized protein n=1 Tax=Streptomyces zinciresistens K42 TaxID=700597 RepID=G2G6P3_9ACTN|nr:hypothetical protein SZN_05754 [Streptomyces zinciresistens K42]